MNDTEKGRTIEERAASVARSFEQGQWLQASNVTGWTAERYVADSIEREFADVVECDPRVHELVAAAREAKSQMGIHSHWDSTMRHGAGCETCINQRNIAKKIDAALQKFEK